MEFILRNNCCIIFEKQHIVHPAFISKAYVVLVSCKRLMYFEEIVFVTERGTVTSRRFVVLE